MDALRFFAFFCVFICHAPRYQWFPGVSTSFRLVATAYDTVARAGAASLCLFFLLSAFLISELLLRERETTGSIHLKSFYLRRILRIWPLYYFAVGLGVAVSYFAPHLYGLSSARIAYLLLFVAWLGTDFHSNPAGPLWSISVEELFYVVWPSLAKTAGKRSLAIGSCFVIALSLVFAALFCRNWWYSPLPHFVFFGSGGLLAVALHRRAVRLALPIRAVIFLIGIGSWIFVAAELLSSSGPGVNVARFALMDLGCVAVFIAFLNIDRRLLPAWLLYLGRISYGLYVYHLFSLVLVTTSLRALKVNVDRWSVVWIIQASALALTIGAASVSYRFLEKPFLRLKERFTFVRSGAGASDPKNDGSQGGPGQVESLTSKAVS